MLHALPVSAAADGVFTVSDRTEVRVRAPDLVANAPAALDLDTRIDARATLTSHSTEYTLGYLPSLTVLNVTGAGVTPALLHSALASAAWHTHKVMLMLTERASYGTLAFESLSAVPAPGTPTTTTPGGQPAPIPTVTLIAPAQSLTFASTDTSLISTLALRPWALSAKVGFQASGGVNGDQSALPFQSGPYGSLLADYRAGVRDHLVTVASATDASFSTGTEDLLITADEQWRHHWARLTDTTVSGGVYGARVRAATDAPYQAEGNPEAAVTLSQGFEHGANKGQLRLDVRLTPFIDPLSGLIDQHIQGTVDASVSHRKITLRAFVTASESINQGTTTASQLVSGEVDAAYRFDKNLTFDAGARTMVEKQNEATTSTDPTAPPGITSTSFNQTVFFVAVTVRAPKVHF